MTKLNAGICALRFEANVADIPEVIIKMWILNADGNYSCNHNKDSAEILTYFLTGSLFDLEIDEDKLILTKK